MTDRRDRDERVSLHGLDPEEALRALLAVKPDDEPARGEQRRLASPPDHGEPQDRA